MPPLIYHYTVTNSYKGGLFMRTYSRNVRRAWDGDDHRPLKRMRIEESSRQPEQQQQAANKENTLMPYDLEDNLERAIRETSVAALSSSPSRKNSTIFSMESHDGDRASTMTPPSSPPPQLQLTPPNVKPRKPTFSCLDKSKKEKQKQPPQSHKRKHDALTAPPRREESESLIEIRNSARAPSTAPQPSFISVNTALPCVSVPPTEQTATPPPQSAPTAKPLVQSILDFGQSLQPLTCATCNMTYHPTVPADAQLHHMYHNRHSSGIDLGKPFLKSAMKWCYEVPHIPGSVIVVDRKLSAPARKTVVKVLEVVNKELGSVDISEKELWSQRLVPGDFDGDGRKCDRYKVFMHVIDGKCVGVCLAERIGQAYELLSGTPISSTEPDVTMTGTNNSSSVHGSNETTPKPKDAATSATIDHPPTPTSTTHTFPDADTFDSVPLSLSKISYPAIVGVSRIWTSRTHRRQGIASNLLECVTNQFIYGMEINRDKVGFSCPTQMGMSLARTWFGHDDGKEKDVTMQNLGTNLASGSGKQEAVVEGFLVYIEE